MTVRSCTAALAAALLVHVGGVRAQSADELLNDGKNTENVTTYGMGYDQKRYSPLKQIDTSNVKRLVPVWNTTLSNLLGEQAQRWLQAQKKKQGNP